MSDHGNLQQFNFDSSTPEAAAAAIVDRLVDQLVARYAVASGTQQRLQIEVDGIADVAQYGALMKYLGGLEFIDSVDVEEVRAGCRVVVRINAVHLGTGCAICSRLDGRLEPSMQLEMPVARRVLTWRGDRP